MTRRTRTLALFALVLVAGAVVAPLATAAPATPVGPDGPGGGSTSAPTEAPSTTSTPTESATSATPTRTSNGSSGGGVFGAVGGQIKSGIVAAARELGINRSLAAVDQLRNTSVSLVGYTPHANGVGRWYHNPTNNVWKGNWETYRTTGRYLWFTAVLAGAGLGVIFRATGTMNPAQSRQWARRWVVGVLVGGSAWELGNLYLHGLDVVKRMLLVNATAGTSGATIAGVGAVVLIVGIAVTTTMAWAILLVVLIIAMSVVGIDLITPYLGALIAARAIPVGFVNQPADAGAKLWATLPALTLPMAVFLTAGFAPMATAIADGTAFGVLATVLVQIGAFLLALFSPYLVWTKASSTTMLSVGFTGGSFAMNQRYEQAKSAAGSAKQGVQGARDAARGARGKAPVGDGGRGYDAGAAVRQTGGALRPGGSGSTARARERTRRMLRRGGSSSRDTTDTERLAETAAQNDRTNTLQNLLDDK